MDFYLSTNGLQSALPETFACNRNTFHGPAAKAAERRIRGSPGWERPPPNPAAAEGTHRGRRWLSPQRTQCRDANPAPVRAVWCRTEDARRVKRVCVTAAVPGRSRTSVEAHPPKFQVRPPAIAHALLVGQQGALWHSGGSWLWLQAKRPWLHHS